MFKKLLFCICLPLLSGCGGNAACIYDDEIKTSFCGAANLQNKRYKALHVSGCLHAKHIIVDKNAIINGAMTAEDVQIGGNLTVNGSSSLAHSNITQKTTVNGFLEATDTTFSEIEAHTRELVLKNSTVISILIGKPSPSEDHKTQIVFLDHTTVNGNITFEKAGGKVVTRNGTVISGNIIGGTEDTK